MKDPAILFIEVVTESIAHNHILHSILQKRSKEFLLGPFIITS